MKVKTVDGLVTLWDGPGSFEVDRLGNLEVCSPDETAMAVFAAGHWLQVGCVE